MSSSFLPCPGPASWVTGEACVVVGLMGGGGWKSVKRCWSPQCPPLSSWFSSSPCPTASHSEASTTPRRCRTADQSTQPEQMTSRHSSRDSPTPASGRTTTKITADTGTSSRLDTRCLLDVHISLPPNVDGLLTNYFTRTLQIGLELTRRTVAPLACVVHSLATLCLKSMNLNSPPPITAQLSAISNPQFLTRIIETS